MTDYFELLHESRRPWLDEENLKLKFLELSGEAHPDRVHGAAAAERLQAGERFAELNAAYNCLREPKRRLAHLFELETGAKAKEIEQPPPGAMEMLMEIGQLCRGADAFLAENARVTSPLLKVAMFERAQEWTEKLAALQRRLNTRREQLDAELKEMNAAWENAPATGLARAEALPLKRLEGIAREFGYLWRWSGQIQERVVQLSL